MDKRGILKGFKGIDPPFVFVGLCDMSLSGLWFRTMEFYDFPIQLGMSSSQLLKSMIFQRARSTTKQILLQSTCSAKQLTSSRPKWTIYGWFTVKIAISNGDFS
jgi:hypothetical protein